MVVYYRLYFMAKGTEHIDRFHEFAAVDDDAAIAACDAWRGHQTAELWSGDRKVTRWDPPDISSKTG